MEKNANTPGGIVSDNVEIEQISMITHWYVLMRASAHEYTDKDYQGGLWRNQAN